MRARGERASALRRARGRLSDAAHEARRAALCASLALDRSRDGQEEAPRGVVQLAGHVPFAGPLRQLVRHRPGTLEVGVSSLLMGGQCRLDAVGFAEAIGTLRYGSTPMLESPHVALLLEAGSHGPLDDATLLASEYVAFGRRVVEVWGDYFGATDDAALCELARGYVAWALEDAPRTTEVSGSPATDGILVAPVASTACFQVMDGHHRVAKAIARGEERVRVQRTWWRTETPVQRRLRLAGGAGPPRLHQPLALRELDGAIVARNCEDRVLRFVRALDGAAAHAGRRFLDVGAGHGWYLQALKARGWRVLGVEPDALEAELGTDFLGLDDTELVVADPLEALRTLGWRAEAVSCLALEGWSRTWPPERLASLLDALDGVTAGLLFVEERDGDRALSALVRHSTSLRREVDLGACDDPGSRHGVRRRLVALSR